MTDRDTRKGAREWEPGDDYPLPLVADVHLCKAHVAGAQGGFCRNEASEGSDYCGVHSATGIELIAAERQRQIDAEGWTPEHDDGHENGELAHAAAVYASNRVDIQDVWPWGARPKTKDERSNLIRAGALIAAELDRLQRLADRG